MKYGKIFRVFIASPGDVKEERDILIEVIQELNKPNSLLDVAGKGCCKLEVADWRDAVPGAGLPENVILGQYPIESWDIFIGILWKRFGIPTGERDPKTGLYYDSGTDHEFKKAYECWIEKNRPQILFYRRTTAPSSLLEIDPEQYRKVDSFFKNFNPDGIHPGLCQPYETPQQFKDRVQSNLVKAVRDMITIPHTIPPVREKEEKTPFMVPPLPVNFICRESLVDDLRERLFRETDTAIYGLNGLGKSTIAIALAHDPKVREFFKRGILWVPLGQEPEVMAILGNCAADLGIPLDKIRDVKTVEGRKRAIIEAIGEHPVLIIIDDAWKQDEAEDFKIACPKCFHILTTQVLKVAVAFARKEAIKMPRLSEQESLKLLHFYAPRLVDNEPTDAVKLVDKVGGIPHALILAGKRIKKNTDGLPLNRIKIELEKILFKEELPQDGVIKKSYEALDDDARVILQYLSIFPPEPNSFSEDAALAVSGKTEDEIEHLNPLIDFMLLEFKESGESFRYMLNTAISQYARKKRTDETTKTAYKRMVDFFVDYVEKHEKEYDFLELERRNIDTALQAADELGMKEAFLKGVNAFFHFMEANGLYKLAEKKLERAKEAARFLDNKKGLIDTLLHLGAAACIHSNYDDAERYYNESLELARKNEDKISIIDSLKGLGEIASIHGEIDKQEKYCTEALEKAREINDKRKIIELLTSLGAMEDIHGNYDRAEEYFREGMKIKADDKLNNSNLYANLGWVAAHIGDFERAKGYWQKGLKLAEEINHKGNISFLNSNLGWVEDRWGHNERAEKHFETGLKIAREIGYLNMIGVILTNRGAKEIHRGDYENAKKYLQEGLDIVRKSGHVERTGVLHENLAIAAYRLGNCEEAEQHLNEGMEVAKKGRIIERESALYTFMGELAVHRGGYGDAQEHLRKGLKLALEIKNPERLGLVYKNLGVLAGKQGNLEKAEQDLQEALRQAQKINYRWLLSSIYSALGEHYYIKKDYGKASGNFNNALEIGQEIHSQDMIAAAEYGLAITAAAQGNMEHARKQGRESLDIFEKIGHYKRVEVKQWFDRL